MVNGIMDARARPRLAENAVREEEGMIRTRKLSVEEKLKAVLDNKNLPLPWSRDAHRSDHHEGRTCVMMAKQRVRGSRTRDQQAAAVWRGRWDDAGGQSHKENKLESTHHFGVFAGIVPRAGEFAVLTPEGAVSACTVHTPSEDQKWDTEFMSRVKGAPWDINGNAGDDINDGGITERVDARPPDPPIELPPRINVGSMYIRRVNVEKCGPAKWCPGCQKVTRGTVPSCIVATHRGLVP